MNANDNLEYLRTNVKPILAGLFEEIAKRAPDDVISFSIDYLRQTQTTGDENKEEEN